MSLQRICPISGEIFTINDEELKFYKNLELVPPTLAPLERQRRRISFRNFTSLYHRSCSKTGKTIISMYDADAPFPVYSVEEWWKDDWDAKQFGRAVDLGAPFFPQYGALANEVPRTSLNINQTENCPFGNSILQSRNCYMTFGCIHSEDCLYGHIIWSCKQCIDCLYAYESEWCSNSIDIVGCYEVHYSQEVVNCQDSYFLYDCRSCQNCFACFGLRNKKYCLFNKQLTKEVYFSSLEKLLPLSHEAVETHSEWLENSVCTSAITPASFSNQAEDSTGNHIYYSKNCIGCFDIKRCENTRYCFTVESFDHSCDISFAGGGGSRFCVDSLTLASCERVHYSHFVQNSSDVTCSEFCFNCHDLFGCNGLRNAQYCILNNQYSKEDYFSLRSQIIERMIHEGEWGEFFPVTISPFAYNEAIVNDYHPSEPSKVTQYGWRWKESHGGDKNLKDAVEAALIPAFAHDLDDTICGQVFLCPETKKAFKLIKAEIDLCKRLKIPAPRKAFMARHRERLQRRGERRLWSTQCAACKASLISAFDPALRSRVMCETCYLSNLA